MDELVVHFRGVDRMLGSPARLNVAIVVAAVATVALVGAGIVIGGPVTDNLAYFFGAVAAAILVLFVYGRLRFANAGLFLSGGRVGVIDFLGRRTGVEASSVDRFQLGTLATQRGRHFGVLLLIDRSGRSLLRLNVVELIPPEDLVAFSQRSGIPIQGSLQEAYTPAELAGRFPRSLSRAFLTGDTIAAHPYWLGLIVFVLCVVGGVGAWFVIELTGRGR